MTTAEAVPTTGSVSGKKNAVFYVVPVVLLDDTSKRSALYFNPVTKDGKWQIVPAKNLNAKAQGNDASVITLRQPSASEINDFANLEAGEYDPSMLLYAGVAKTLGKGDSLPGVFSVLADGTMTIPVTIGTTRGLVLVFSKTATTADGDVAELLAVTDPEIKNSTGTGGD